MRQLGSDREMTTVVEISTTAVRGWKILRTLPSLQTFKVPNVCCWLQPLERHRPAVWIAAVHDSSAAFWKEKRQRQKAQDCKLLVGLVRLWEWNAFVGWNVLCCDDVLTDFKFKSTIGAIFLFNPLGFRAKFNGRSISVSQFDWLINQPDSQDKVTIVRFQHYC